jgi:hypothetical protein
MRAKPNGHGHTHAKRRIATRRDEPAHQPRVGVLLAFDREHPGGQQQRHEHQRNDDRDRHRVRVRRRGPAVQLGPVDGQWAPDRAEHRPREPEPLDRELRERRDLLQRSPDRGAGWTSVGAAPAVAGWLDTQRQASAS